MADESWVRLGHRRVYLPWSPRQVYAAAFLFGGLVGLVLAMLGL